MSFYIPIVNIVNNNYIYRNAYNYVSHKNVGLWFILFTFR